MVTEYARYQALILYGFTDDEAEELKSIPFEVPYWKHCVDERMDNYNAAKRQGVSRDEFLAAVQAEYDERKWRTPWEMLRAYEDEYKAKFPAYESPWEKRGRKNSRPGKYERDDQKYPKGGAYR